MDKIKVLFILTHCTKSGPIQQMLNIITNIDRNLFETHVITVYPEDSAKSMLKEYLMVSNHTFIPVSKINILLGKTQQIKAFINDYNPSVIHTFGVFPDYMISKMHFKNHVLTSRNYVYDDYVDQYGIVKGLFLAKLHLYAIKHAKYSVCCSKSLHNIYLRKIKINLPYIQNGINTSLFKMPTHDEKRRYKELLGLPADKSIFIYAGVFNNRKNQSFLLKCIENNSELNDCFFLLLGNGPNYFKLKDKFSHCKNIEMPGNKSNVADYLKASDYYVSTSISEGLPNGVLEAMGCGLPVVLSDIEQHIEILSEGRNFGVMYRSGDEKDFVSQIGKIKTMDWNKMSYESYTCVNSKFSSLIMSKNYQDYYLKILREDCNE